MAQILTFHVRTRFIVHDYDSDFLISMLVVFVSSLAVFFIFVMKEKERSLVLQTLFPSKFSSLSDEEKA